MAERKVADYGYTAPQYYYWKLYDDGGKYIHNYGSNYVMKQYDDGDGYGKYWDCPKEKVNEYNIYGEYVDWHWEYTYDANGNHPTVSGNGANLKGGAGNDSIWNSGDKVTISSGAGNDSIWNSGDKVTISSGAGNDSIQNWGVSVKIDGGEGKDTIENWVKNVTINGGSGNDEIRNSGSNVSISGGDDSSNLISLTGGKDITVKTGADIDSIVVDSYKVEVSIESGTGKNLISLIGSWYGNFVSVNGGANDVSVYSSDNTVITGSGDDTITVNSSSNSIVTSDYALLSGNLDADYVSLISGNYNTIETDYGDDTVKVLSARNTINAAGQKDSILSEASYLSINSGSGDDTVWIKEGSYGSTIDAGDNNDSIRSESAYVSINSGAGDDTVENWGKQVTIESGGLNNSEGKNSITNHVDNVTISGGGKVDTITNYTGKAVSINAGAGNDVIKLYGVESAENMLRAILNPLLKAGVDFNEKKINNFIDNLNTLLKHMEGFSEISHVETSYKDKIPNEFKDRLKKISSKIGELMDGIDELENALKTFGYSSNELAQLKNGLVKVQKVNGKAIKFIDNAEIVTGALKEYADNKIFATFAKEMLSDFEKDANGRWAFVWKKDYGDYTTVRGGKGNDKIYGDEFAFHVYEYTAGDGNDIIYNWNSNDTLSISGGNYTGTVKGNDYVVTVGKGSITFKNYTSRRVKQIDDNYERIPLHIEGNNASTGYHKAGDSWGQPIVAPPEGISVEDDTATTDDNFSGEINTSRYYTEYITKIDASNAGNVEIIGNESIREIRSGKGSDKVHASSSFSVIQTGAGKDFVSNFGNSNSVNAGDGDDFISNIGDENIIESGAGKDTIFSDGSKNVFVYNAGSGNKIIYGFGKTDTLQIVDSASKYTTKKSGSDIIVTVGKDKITLSGAASLSKVNIEKKFIRLVSLTSSADNFDNYNLDGATIRALGGDDNIWNSSNDVSIDGGDGNDNISNGGNNVTLSGGAGDDTIDNNGHSTSINAGAGNDSIHSNAPNVTIDGGTGNDYVDAWHLFNVYVYTGGNDTLQSFHDISTLVIADNWTSQRSNDGTVTINVEGKGSITINNYWAKVNIVSSLADIHSYNVAYNYDSNTILIGNTDYDYFGNGGNNVTINAGKGNDYVDNWNQSNNSSINGGAGNDSLRNGSKYSTLRGGDGNDDIDLWNESENVLADGGNGNDNLESSGKNSTLVGGAGDDTLNNWSEAINASISGGDGKDTVWNGADSVTIDAGAGDDFVDNANAKTSVKIDLGAGNDSLWNHASNSTIIGGAGSDTLENFNAANNSINAGDGNNLIYGSGNNVTITAGAGDDTIDFYPNYFGQYDENANNLVADAGDGNNRIYSGASNSKIKTGKGDDYISNSGNNASINTGSGNDYIYSYSSNTTINGGAGDDSVYGGGVGRVYIYRAGDGNDYISSFGAFDTLVIDGAEYTTTNDDWNVFVHVGDNTITLSGAAYLSKVNIATSNKGIVPVNVIENSDNNITLKGTSASNVITNYGSNVKISGGKNADSIYSSGENISISTAAGNDTIYSWGANNTVNAGKGNDYVYMSNGVLVYANGDGNDTINIDGGWVGNEVTISLTSGTLGATSVSDAGDIVVKVGKGSIKFVDNAQANKINVTDSKGNTTVINEGRQTITNSKNSKTIKKTAGSYYVFNSGSKVKVTTGSGSDGIVNAGSNVTINAGANNDQISNEGNKVSINAGTGNDYVYNGGGSKVTIRGGEGDDTVFNRVAEIWNEETQQWENGSSPNNAILDGDDGDDYVHNSGGSKVSIKGGNGSDTIYNEATGTWNYENDTWEITYSPDNALIDSGDSDDYIFNEGNNVSITGGAGNDTISGWGANVLYDYTSGDGNDEIYGFNTTSTLQIGDGTGTYSTVKSGEDIIVTVGEGKISLIGAANLDTLNIAGTKKTSTTKTYTNSSSSKVTLGSSIKVGDASARTKAIKITGNKLANTILGGSGKDSLYGADGNDYLVGNAGADKLYGQNGDDTLWGSSGNDTLKGGAGADVFIYNSGEGKDVISDFENDDMFQITGTFSASYNSSKKTIAFTVDSVASAITLKDFTATTFNINGDAWKVSGSILVKK